MKYLIIIAAFYCNLQPVAAQTLPESVSDIGRSENEEYLDQQIRKERAERLATAAATSITGTSSGTFHVTGPSTIGIQNYTTVITTTSGAFTNMWMVVASTNPSHTVSSTFTWAGSMPENSVYRVSWAITKNGATGGLFLRWGSDAAATYKFALSGFNTNGVADETASNSTTHCRLTGGAALEIGVDDQGTGFMQFTNKPSDATAMQAFGMHNFADDNPFLHSNQISCSADLAAAPTSFQLMIQKGTFSGFIQVEQLILP